MPTLTRRTVWLPVAILLTGGLIGTVGYLCCAAERPAPPPKNPPPLVERIDPDRVQFASNAVRMRYDAIRRRIAELVDSRWKTEPLTLTQQQWDRDQYFCKASWHRDLPPKPDWQPYSNPYPKPAHTISLVMRPTKDDPRVMESVELNVTRVPPHNGWATQFRLQCTAEGDDRLMVWYDHNQRRHEFATTGRWAFFMPSITVSASDRPKGWDTELIARADVPGQTLQEQLVYQRQLVTAVATPVTLRDLELKLCDELEAALRETVETGHLSMIDWTDVRSDNPPRKRPLLPGETESVDAASKRRLIEDGVAQLDRRRQRWRTEAADLHEALRQAFPALVEWAAHRPGTPPTQ